MITPTKLLTSDHQESLPCFTRCKECKKMKTYWYYDRKPDGNLFKVCRKCFLSNEYLNMILPKKIVKFEHMINLSWSEVV